MCNSVTSIDNYRGIVVNLDNCLFLRLKSRGRVCNAKAHEKSRNMKLQLFFGIEQYGVGEVFYPARKRLGQRLLNKHKSA